MSTSPTRGDAIDLARLSIGNAFRPERPPALVDGERRAVKYLRVSVTDRCNFRCRYCMPEEGVAFAPRQAVLGFEEITRIVRAFTRLGITRVRLTGGEPLLRRDFVDLTRMIAAVPGVEDLALSTNGFLLPPIARELREAGLRRVNISLDSLDPARFRDLTRYGSVERVLEAVDAAKAAGFAPVKLNAVVIKGYNDDELPALVRYAQAKGALLRFIEYMPIGVDGFWSDRTFMSVDEMIAALERDFVVHPLRGFAHEAGIVGGGPARYGLLTPKSGGAPVEVGFITAVSHSFCSSCNRVRVTATGGLQECLAYPGQLSLRDIMRQGGSDDDVTAAIERALFLKGPGHQFEPRDGGVRTCQTMSVTGG